MNMLNILLETIFKYVFIFWLSFSAYRHPIHCGICLLNADFSEMINLFSFGKGPCCLTGLLSFHKTLKSRWQCLRNAQLQVAPVLGMQEFLPTPGI